MTATVYVADAIDSFKDAFDFILHSRDSEQGSGIVQIGGSELWGFTGTHLLVSGVAILVACLISLPIGLWLGHKGKGEFAAISISNIGRAVPSLALLAFFIAYLGVGFLNVVVVLTLLAIPPILTNTYVATRQVERDIIDAGRGMGMTEAQLVRKVELPLALPTIFGGIRISAVNVVATATIAPLASVNTLGTPIINDNVYGPAGQLGASILVALLTVFVYAGLAWVQRLVTPTGLKVGPGRTKGPRFSFIRARGGQQTT
jgi:osmoprotectant transport system permease protein